MSAKEILHQIDKLNVWRAGNQRAPHKPLLLLMALGKLTQGQVSLRFSDCEGPLTDLLREFGPPRVTYHPEYPFWRLQSDGLWTVIADHDLGSRQSNSDPTRTALRSGNAIGSLLPDVRRELVENPMLLREVTHRLLAKHFATSLHQDILDAVGLTADVEVGVFGRRDANFRPQVLTAYEYRCAVCEFDLRLASRTVGLEAAHIKWHQAGGPDIVPNGVALCALHHKLFDLGAFTFDGTGRILVSEHANGSGQFAAVLLQYHGSSLRRPTSPAHYPNQDFLEWHRAQVFKGMARHIG